MAEFGEFFSWWWQHWDIYYEAHKNELPPLDVMRYVPDDLQ